MPITIITSQSVGPPVTRRQRPLQYRRPARRRRIFPTDRDRAQNADRILGHRYMLKFKSIRRQRVVNRDNARRLLPFSGVARSRRSQVLAIPG